MIRVSFIINATRKLSPTADKAILLAKQSKKIECTQLKTECPNHAKEIAINEALESEIIVAVGGDGTCNEIIQGLMESTSNLSSLAIIPNGTGNDFTRMLPAFNPEKFVQSLEQNKSQAIDLACCEFENQIRYFLNIADIGFGAKVIQLMTNQRKNKLGGKFSYSLAIIRAFFAYRKPHIKIVGDDFEFEGKALMIAFCNGRTFGYGLTINPDADLRNGKLNITVIGNVSLFTYLRKLGALKKGNKIIHPEAHYFESKSIEISKMESKVWTEGDGELFGTDLKRVYILPSRIKLIS